MIRQFISKIEFTPRALRDYLLILLGSLVQALSLRLFLVPASLVSGGISGAAQLLHYALGWPIGLVVLAGNLPLFVIGWRYLGGPRFASRTILAILSFSIFTDLLIYLTGNSALTEDPVLNTVFGGLLLGIGLGIVYLGRGTSGGTDILGRILNRKLGISISMAYMITDSLVVLMAGFVFGWEKALYGLLMIYLSGVAADLASEGANITKAGFIITLKPDAVINAIQDELDRGVTLIPVVGGYTRQERAMVYCVVTASEVMRLKTIVHEVDKNAFMVIGQVSEALGEGFKPLQES
ncbi:MAG TPA: YitT family protein [Anaerolineaceae bacterium]|nr:YitT family protein [Anaerolineaceae bacterium]HOR84613.1 YitT family protein [Anaerolineaceae bacterium]HPY33478.1 YitT family protein [Anaerolineaceae bacterium]